MNSRASNSALFAALDAFETAVISFEGREFETELELNAAQEEIRSMQNAARFASQPAFLVVSERFQYALKQKRAKFKTTSLASNVEILKDVRRLLDEEVERTIASHGELSNQTATLQKIGMSADRIASLGTYGASLTHEVYLIEARDQMLIWALFAVFVASSVWIVGKRIGRVFSWACSIFRRVLSIFGLRAH